MNWIGFGIGIAFIGFLIWFVLAARKEGARISKKDKKC